MNITLYPLGSYNAGHFRPFTIELDDLDHEGYQQAVAQGLWNNSSLQEANVTSTKCEACGHVVIAGENDDCEMCGDENVIHKPTEEEWVVCDYDDIPRSLVGQYDLSKEFWEYKELLESSQLDQEIIDAGLYCGIELGSIEEAYAGTYTSNEDFAYQLADECELIDHDANWPMSCIDWEQAARDLMMNYVESNNHYFRGM